MTKHRLFHFRLSCHSSRYASQGKPFHTILDASVSDGSEYAPSSSSHDVSRLISLSSMQKRPHNNTHKETLSFRLSASNSTHCPPIFQKLTSTNSLALSSWLLLGKQISESNE
ncbi:hypothetical protein CDAR_585001 [Caerostris darwini]|uniref:Uncharacterized protein n=1 Tax=Caerostris darwini TaxID=1538125 RepID=A0AAV4Q8V3_9ARAC|nr:hypothetical protein CDAR_585001 [Caerostris darwini]